MLRLHVIPGLAAVSFAVFTLLYLTDRPVYFAILNAIHVHPSTHPFLDTRFVTAQVQCWSRGIDVYTRNPCDPLGRTFDYSPLWLRLPFLARSDSWTPLFGLTIDLAFLFALFCMPWRLDDAFDAVVAIASIMSWATMFATERGNTDLLIFAVSVLFAHLALRSFPARCAGYATILCVGLLKFYPLTLLALLIRERGLRLWMIGSLCAFTLAAFLVAFHAELQRIEANMASALFGDMFGARGLPLGLPLLLDNARIRDASGIYVGPAALDPEKALLGWTLFGVTSAGCLLIAVRRGRSPLLRDMLDRIGTTARSLLLVGAVLCVGCFFGHQNIGYRAVLLLLALPGLLALVKVAPTPRTRSIYRATSLLVVLVLWDGILSRSRPGWLVMQLAWWWIVCVLLMIAVSLLSGEVAQLLGRAGPSRSELRDPDAAR